jgi:hypothetical protein
MTMNIRAATADLMAQELLDAITNAVTAGYFEIYDGALPASPDTPISTEVLLGTLTCAIPEATRSGSVLTFGTITEDSAADAGGTAQFARLYDGDDNAIVDFDITDNAGSGAIKMNTTTITIGGPIGISSFVITI